MIGGLIRLLFRIASVLPWLFALAWRRMRLGKRTVVELSIGGGGAEDLTKRLERERVIRRIARDPKVRAVRLNIRGVPMGWAGVQGLRAGLVELREAGVLILVHFDVADDRCLYLAGLADQVWMPPGGEVVLTGIGSQLPFYGPALERIGIKVSIHSAGVYKSMGEPYTRAFPTVANREALNTLLDDLDAQIATTIAEDRQLKLSVVRSLQVESPLSAEQAREHELIDRVGYADEMEEAIEEVLGGSPRVVSQTRYSRLTRLTDLLGGMGRKRARVAVVHLDGPIVSKRPRVGRAKSVIASDDVVPALDALIDHPAIKAVVLVINSPGGSALASDLIARSVIRLNEKKPVVVSMEGVAASGGYYIAAPAREILANPGTITGSIGVVGGKVVLGPGLAKWGIHAEPIGPSRDGGFHGIWTDFDEDQVRRYRASLRRVYERFLAVCAAGRNRTRDEVHAVAQGRVWTGTQAVENGLVDQLGGVDAAVQRAQALAEIADQPVRRLVMSFEASRFAALSAMMGGGATIQTHPDALDAALATLGPAGWLPRLIRQAPTEPLAVVPAVLDPAAWSGWMKR